jgi:hypothetical protein
VHKATKSSVFPLVLFILPGSSSLGGLVEDGRPVSTSLSESEMTPASGTGADGSRDATFSAFAFTSPLTIQLLVHLGISTLTVASDLIFRIALYVLLKLAVVDAQRTRRKRLYSTCLLSPQALAQAKTLATEPFTQQ